MRFAVVALGSAGDLHPFLAIARELARRGHEVTLLGQAPYQAQVEREGVGFVAAVNSSTHERTLTHPLLWHPLDGFGVLWRHLCVPAIEPTCEALGELAHRSAEPLIVLASPMAAGARFARDRWPDRIRLRSGYTAPLALRSTADPMFLGEWQVPNWLPPSLRRGLWRALDRWKLEPMARPVLTKWQRQWATPALTGSVFGDWLHSPDGGLALYPSWFAPVTNHWLARGVVQTGFPVFEPQGVEPLPTDLQKFLDTHPCPIAVYPGSAAGSAERHLELVLSCCRKMGLPAVILAPHLHASMPRTRHELASTILVKQATLSLLLPRCAAFAHHGGIGSVAQGLAHGIPQFILASAYDQFENGERVARLSAGRYLPLRDAQPNSVFAAMGAVLANHGRRPSPSNRPIGATAVAESCNRLEIKP